MEDSLLEFPCQFPIKAIGLDQADFQATVTRIISAHAGELSADTITTSPSSNGKYLAVSIMITAKSQDQLDAIYRELTAIESVRFVL